MVHIPYTKLELLVASIGLEKKLDTEEKQQALKNAIEKVGVAPEDKMKATADFIGISLETLVASPNMDSLISKFEEHITQKMIDAMKEIGLTDKEAWSLFLLWIGHNAFDLD